MYVKLHITLQIASKLVTKVRHTKSLQSRKYIELQRPLALTHTYTLYGWAAWNACYHLNTTINSSSRSSSS